MGNQGPLCVIERYGHLSLSHGPLSYFVVRQTS